MLRFPAALTPEGFLRDHWQKKALFLPEAIDGPTPAITQDELGWLATLEDVESRIVFTDRNSSRTRYRAETGPFDEEYLQQLPGRDWTLLVHDVEKHLPELRAIFACVPFIPDWRIDDLMVSFAAPGGSVGPHNDNYDVFLCQGTGTRNWSVTSHAVSANPAASDELALLEDFSGDNYECSGGDVLYIPPGVAHWGLATNACMTYSIGMRAPQLADLREQLPDSEQRNPFFRDPDLTVSEAVPGYLSAEALCRAQALVGDSDSRSVELALGRSVTSTKNWLTPEGADEDETAKMLEMLAKGGMLQVHGMARLAFSDENLFLNGASFESGKDATTLLRTICAERELRGRLDVAPQHSKMLGWMLQRGAFEIPEHL